MFGIETSMWPTTRAVNRRPIIADVLSR